MVFAPSAEDIGWGSRHSQSFHEEDSDDDKTIIDKQKSKSSPNKEKNKDKEKSQQKKKGSKRKERKQSSVPDKKKNDGDITDNSPLLKNKKARETRIEKSDGVSDVGENDISKSENKNDDSAQNYYGPASLTSSPSSSYVTSAGFPLGVNVKTQNDNDVHVPPNSIVTFQPQSTSDCESQQIAIIGRAKIFAMEGNVEICGYTLKSIEQKTIIVDSPTWMSSLCISRSKEEGDAENNENSSNSKECHVVKIKIISMEADEFSFALLPMDQVPSPIIIGERWNDAANKILKDSRINIERTQSNPQEKRENMKGKNRILVCGAKNVGKSTFVKFMCNRLLSTSSYEKVALLDCDVGQPELSPPGLLSLTVLSKPLLCPPHVHMVCDSNDYDTDQDTDEIESYAAAKEYHSAFYYGSTTSKMNPISYTKGIRELMNDYTKLCENTSGDIPLVVNTNGWVKGMGFEILSSTIDVVDPIHIVQILGSTKAKFFDLTLHASPNRTIHIAFTQSKRKDSSSVPGSAPISRTVSSTSLLGLSQESLPDSKFFDVKDNIPIAASILRNFRLCVYFLGGYRNFLKTEAMFHQSGIVDDNCNIALTLARIKPYAVPFDAISSVLMDEDGNSRICTLQSSEDTDYIYDIFNGSVVGLCSDMGDTGSNLHHCVGLGIVRSIDRKNRLYYILTPLPAPILQSQVTRIVKGQTQLPFECIFLGQNAESFPYQSCDGISFGTSEVMKSSMSY
jgi:polynucleotide 5'-hydroxyl-kinase GRC3/NOL9